MACRLRPAECYAGASFDRRRAAIAGNPRFLPDRIDREPNPIRYAACLDYGLADSAVEHKAHRDDTFQRVALAASAGSDIRLSARYPNRIVEDIVDRLSRDAGAVISDGNLARAGRDLDLDLGRNTNLLDNVDRVVNQLLEDD